MDRILSMTYSKLCTLAKTNVKTKRKLRDETDSEDILESWSKLPVVCSTATTTAKLYLRVDDVCIELLVDWSRPTGSPVSTINQTWKKRNQSWRKLIPGNPDRYIYFQKKHYKRDNTWFSTKMTNSMSFFAMLNYHIFKHSLQLVSGNSYLPSLLLFVDRVLKNLLLTELNILHFVKRRLKSCSRVAELAEL